MKKNITAFLLIVVAITFTLNVFAQSTLKPENIKHSSNNNLEIVKIMSIGKSEYKASILNNPVRLIIDISDAKLTKNETIEVNSKLIKTIRCAQNDKTAARVVIDLKGNYQFKIQQENDQIIVYIGNAPGINQDIKNSNLSSARANVGSSLASLLGNINISYFKKNDADQITIDAKGYKSYNVFRLADEDRIIIDITGAKVPAKQNKINVGSNFVKSVRYSQLNKDTARIVFDVKGQPKYSVDAKYGKILLNIDKSQYKNITYNNVGDRAFLKLNGAKLTDGGEEVKRFYKISYESSGKKCIISFPSNLADLGEGLMPVNDTRITSVQIEKNEKTKRTSIIIHAKDKFVYEVYTRPEVKDTAITILKPASKGEKLVVIDAGHGGRETGAIQGTLYEKDLNLDIALKLNKLLKSKNIKTYMIRNNDDYVGLFERAYIANDLNATLYLSIHNNAINDSDYGGSMTLYYPGVSGGQKINSMKFAQVIQNNLLSVLKTKDRKIIERPRLVVLKATKMPAALAEIAFMTNKKDRDNLKSDSFRNKAAEALCKSVVESLKFK